MDGILPIWKPAGMTSHDVVFKLRKILSIKKIGHTGTLDPEVEGVLVACVGKATRLVEFLLNGRKCYEGEVTLGYSTETEDQTGEIIERVELIQLPPKNLIQQEMNKFQGTITQIPPMYSAVKVDGKRLYEYARQGETVERPKRQVDIYSFKLMSELIYNEDKKTASFDFKVECGKGTYVRTLAVDLGKKLGFPAHMSKLKRTASDGFTAEETYALEEVVEAVEGNTLDDLIYPLEHALGEFPRIDIENEEDYKNVYHSRVLPADYFGSEMDELTALYYQGEFLGLYEPHPSKEAMIKPRKMFI